MVPVFGLIRVHPVGVSVSVSVSGWACTTRTTTEKMSADSRGGRASGRGGIASKEFGGRRRRVGGGCGDVDETLACLGKGVCDRVWEGDAMVSGNGRPIEEGGERVEIGKIISLGRAATTRPAVIALGGFSVGGKGMPPSELHEIENY